MYDEVFRSFQGSRPKILKTNMVQAQLKILKSLKIAIFFPVFSKKKVKEVQNKKKIQIFLIFFLFLKSFYLGFLQITNFCKGMQR